MSEERQSAEQSAKPGPDLGLAEDPQLRELGNELRAALLKTGGAGFDANGGHPTDQDLAAFLDLGRDDEGRIEQHLAVCAECRQVASAVAAARTNAVVEDPAAERARRGSRFGRLALAAAVVAAAGITGWWSLSVDEDSAGLDIGAYQSSAEWAPALALLQGGDWPQNPVQQRYALAGETSIVRSASIAAAVPLSPRWSGLSSGAPGVEFVFAAGPDVNGAQEASKTGVEWEIHVLDAEERPVARWRVRAQESGGPEGLVSAMYPAAAQALDPGSDYFWKVNTLSEGAATGSDYVPFSLLSAAEQRSVEAETERLRARPAAAALALARRGLLDRSAMVLFAGAAGADQSRLARSLAVRLFESTGLDAELAQLWATELESRAE